MTLVRLSRQVRRLEITLVSFYGDKKVAKGMTKTMMVELRHNNDISICNYQTISECATEFLLLICS